MMGLGGIGRNTATGGHNSFFVGGIGRRFGVIIPPVFGVIIGNIINSICGNIVRDY